MEKSQIRPTRYILHQRGLQIWISINTRSISVVTLSILSYPPAVPCSPGRGSVILGANLASNLRDYPWTFLFTIRVIFSLIANASDFTKTCQSCSWGETQKSTRWCPPHREGLVGQRSPGCWINNGDGYMPKPSRKRRAKMSFTQGTRSGRYQSFANRMMKKQKKRAERYSISGLGYWRIKTDHPNPEIAQKFEVDGCSVD